MVVIKKTSDYQVDGRVSIALDALDDKQKRAVGGLIRDRAHFLESASDSRRISKLSKNKPLYALKAPSGLRIVYSMVGNEIVVLDLMRQATLNRYGPKASKARVRGSKAARPASHSKKMK